MFLSTGTISNSALRSVLYWVHIKSERTWLGEVPIFSVQTMPQIGLSLGEGTCYI